MKKYSILLLMSLLAFVEIRAQSLVTGENLENYSPDVYTPIKNVRVNFVLMRKNDGTGNFDTSNAEHKKILKDMILMVNHMYANNQVPASGDACYSSYSGTLSHSRIQFSLEKIYYVNNTQLWNNNSSVNLCNHGNVSSLNDSIVATQTGNSVGVNIYLTEDQTNYNKVVLGETNCFIPCSTNTCTPGYSGVSCAAYPSTNSGYNSYVYCQNYFTKYYDMKNGMGCAPGGLGWDVSNVWETYYGWYNGGGVAINLAHELGHILGLPHLCSCNNLMVGGSCSMGATSRLRQDQLATMHHALNFRNIKKYVKDDYCTYDNAHSITIYNGQNIIWSSRRKLKGNIVVKNGGVLTIRNETIMAGGSAVTIEPGGILKLEGDGRILRNCCNSTPLTFNIDYGAELIVDSGAVFLHTAETVINLHGILEIKPNAYICRQGNPDVSNASDGEVLINNQYLYAGSAMYSVNAGNNTLIQQPFEALYDLWISDANVIANTSFHAGSQIVFHPRTLMTPSSTGSILAEISYGSSFGCASIENCGAAFRMASAQTVSGGEEDAHVETCTHTAPMAPGSQLGQTADAEMVNVHPNPFTGITNVKYTIDKCQPVRLVVVDMFGKEVINVVDQEQHPEGTFEASIDASHLPAGIYMCSLISGNRSSAHRIVLVK